MATRRNHRQTHPLKSTAILNPNSPFLYQQLNANTAPGKNAASTTPNTNLTATNPANPRVAPVAALKHPQTSIQPGRWRLGRPNDARKRLLGTCMRRYPTKKMLRQVRYWVEVRARPPEE